MKLKIFTFIIGMLLIFGGIGIVFAQSNGVDWGRECLSQNLEFRSLDGGGILVRCLLGVAEPTATIQPTMTETPIPTIQPSPTITATVAPPIPTATNVPVGSGIIVDHNSIALFDQIPEEYINAAREIPMMFSDRSVGSNMNDALNCLVAPSWSLLPSTCRRDYTDSSQTTVKSYTATDYDNGLVPELILVSPGSKYDRSNWTYADCQGTWDVMTDLFINSVAPPFLSTKDVLSCQFSYLNVDNGSTILQYFDTDVIDFENFIAENPNKTFVFWTTSLARVIGTRESTEFNAAMREYAITNNKVLMDMADIISHDRNGNQCLDSSGRYPVICRDYTTELNGGHLGSVSGGKIIMAKAFWVLMAQIAGWTP
jgi:hypothetical protein